MLAVLVAVLAALLLYFGATECECRQRKDQWREAGRADFSGRGCPKGKQEVIAEDRFTAGSQDVLILYLWKHVGALSSQIVLEQS